ncbi:MAG: hypothetical protein IID18_01805 [Nitrospinae bacterium]|nr:hypothetical protein [Nitrospinota bacterium]
MSVVGLRQDHEIHVRPVVVDKVIKIHRHVLAQPNVPRPVGSIFQQMVVQLDDAVHCIVKHHEVISVHTLASAKGVHGLDQHNQHAVQVFHVHEGGGPGKSCPIPSGNIGGVFLPVGVGWRLVIVVDKVEDVVQFLVGQVESGPHDGVGKQLALVFHILLDLGIPVLGAMFGFFQREVFCQDKHDVFIGGVSSPRVVSVFQNRTAGKTF